MPVSGSSFVTRAGFVLDPDERIVIHATDEDEATERLGRIELGELELLVEAESVQVVDVREKSEREAGYIPCSVHIPVRLLRTTGADGLDTGKPIVTICETAAPERASPRASSPHEGSRPGR